MSIKKKILKQLKKELLIHEAPFNERNQAIRITANIIEKQPEFLPEAFQQLSKVTRCIITDILEKNGIIEGYIPLGLPIDLPMESSES